MAIRGSCLCGDVVFEVEPQYEFMGSCHCAMCRKTHGSAFETTLGMDAAHVHWRSGREGVRTYESSPGGFRPFCGRCGSTVPNPVDRGRVFVPAGLLDDDPGVRPVGAHLRRLEGAVVRDRRRRCRASTRIRRARRDACSPDHRADEPAPGDGARGSCLCGGVAFERRRAGAAARLQLPLLALPEGARRGARVEPVHARRRLPLRRAARS